MLADPAVPAIRKLELLNALKSRCKRALLADCAELALLAGVIY